MFVCTVELRIIIACIFIQIHLLMMHVVSQLNCFHPLAKLTFHLLHGSKLKNTGSSGANWIYKYIAYLLTNVQTLGCVKIVHFSHYARHSQKPSTEQRKKTMKYWGRNHIRWRTQRDDIWLLLTKKKPNIPLGPTYYVYASD